VKAVSEVLAPLSAQIMMTNEAPREGPRPDQRGPLRAGWPVKIRLADRSERDSLLDAEAYVANLAV
jgi:glycine cleavage system H protein